MRDRKPARRAVGRPYVVGGLLLVVVVAVLSWWLVTDGTEGARVAAPVVTPDPDRAVADLTAVSDVPAPAPGAVTESMFSRRSSDGTPTDWLTTWIRIADEEGRECPGADLTLPHEVPARLEAVDASTFKLRALEGSQVTVFASAPGFADRWRTLEISAANDPNQGGEAALFTLRPLTGQWALVVDRRGRPVPGKTVEFHWKGRQFRNRRVTHGVVGSDGQVYCAYPSRWLQEAYLGTTARGEQPDPDRQLTVVGRAPLTLETPLVPEG